jgi:isoleucyl-tRNA synthetase
VSAESPLIPDRDVDPRRELPEMEREVLERWRERDVFKASLEAREGAESWVFYEGPPTANGPPGSHHVLSRVFKDIYPRFQTMRGYRVERKGGWDCHGLPVEIAVERELGIKSKAEIEDYGIGRFNERCRESVFSYLTEWDRLTERIGFWLDLEHAYRTLDESYIESVWWALSQIHERGLLYEGRKVVPYCPRCETTLSSHEVALGYRDVVDPSVYVKLPVAGGEERLLLWTTTPWTLPGNVAVAVSPNAEYVTASQDGERYVLAADRVGAVLGENAEVLERYTGAELRERFDGYEGPVFDVAEKATYPILAGDFVTTGDGTGIVHLAPAFGEDDYRVASEAGIFDPSDPATLLNPVRPDGTFDGRVRGRGGASYEGRYVKDEALTQELIDDLDGAGLLLRAEEYEHSYPHCWRSEDALIYYAKPSWYIATSQLRDELLAGNETVAWHPERVKEGRFGDWLRNNVDWALSRERYWGTPLPVWRCEEGHIHVVGSFGELSERSGEELSDHHRPFVDEVSFPCSEPGCESTMRRVPEVIDVWFDSGSMPFAQHHFPFQHEDTFESSYPADFICEAQDQTRGWFYSLLAVATLLGRPAPYRDVVCLGLILDEQGQKMSKSRGNAVEPWDVLERYGADAFRWYFFTSKQPWDGYRFSVETIGAGVRLFLKQLWSTYYFYALYARAAGEQLSEAPATSNPANDLDRWALSRTASTAAFVTERLDAYDATSAGRAIGELVDELSNWYVRRSRRRFWEGEPAAFATLRSCLLAVTKMLAPLCPFIADEIYDNLDGELASVHLCDFPEPDAIGARDPELEAAMALARETVRLGLGARGKAKIKVRQPLAEAVVVAAGREREAIEGLSEIVREELNVARIRFVAAADELGSYEVKANYRSLGPMFGSEMPLAAEAVAALDPGRVAEAVRDGGQIGISVSGREHTLSAEDLLLTLRPPEGYAVEREGSHAVALDLEIDEALRQEGRGREVVHAVQNARKNAGLAVEDRIELDLDGDPVLLEASREQREYLSEETLALASRIGAEDGAAPGETSYSETIEIEGFALTIGISRS